MTGQPGLYVFYTGLRSDYLICFSWSWGLYLVKLCTCWAYVKIMSDSFLHWVSTYMTVWRCRFTSMLSLWYFGNCSLRKNVSCPDSAAPPVPCFLFLCCSSYQNSLSSSRSSAQNMCHCCDLCHWVTALWSFWCGGDTLEDFNMTFDAVFLALGAITASKWNSGVCTFF